jgi:hypothetical protein
MYDVSAIRFDSLLKRQHLVLISAHFLFISGTCLSAAAEAVAIIIIKEEPRKLILSNLAPGGLITLDNFSATNLI